MKKNFAEPEMEVVRFNAELAIATSGCNDYLCNGDSAPCTETISGGDI